MNRDKLGIIYTVASEIFRLQFYTPVTHHNRISKTGLIPIKKRFSTSHVNHVFTALFHRKKKNGKFIATELMKASPRHLPKAETLINHDLQPLFHNLLISAFTAIFATHEKSGQN